MDRKKAILFAVKIFPFALNIAIIDFLIPIKYDEVIGKLPLFGLLLTIALLASNFLDFIIGYLTDHVGVKKILQVGIIFCLFGTLIFGYSNSVVIMTLGIFLWGVSYIIMTVPSDTYVLSEFPESYRGSAYGWLYFAQNVSYALAPLLGYYFVTRFGLNIAVLLVALITVISFPLISNIKSSQKKMTLISGVKNAFLEKNMFKEIIEDLGKLGFRQWSLLINIFISSSWFIIVLIGAPLLFFHNDKDLFSGALLSFFFMLPLALVIIPYGKIANSEKNRKWMIIGGFLCGAGLLITFYFIENINWLFVVAFITTTLIYFGWSASEVEVSRYLPEGEKAEYMGIYASARDLGYDLAPLFYGVLAAVNLKLPFLIIGVFVFIAGILFILAHRNYKIQTIHY